jgi:hypothetical protein
MRITLLSFLPLLLGLFLFQSVFSQNVGINDSGAAPNASAMLDVASSNKGMLVPRMNSFLRNLISSPATGLLVYDTNTNSFWYYDGSGWVEIGASVSGGLSDADNDTYIEVEEMPDEDIIRFYSGGTQSMYLDNKTLHLAAPGQSVFVGTNAGTNDDGTSNRNTYVGVEAGTANTSGSRNTTAGYRAGASLTTGIGNIALGAQALHTLTVDTGAVAIGDSALFSTSVAENIAIGYKAGKATTNGFLNIFIGHKAGIANTSGGYNTFIGPSAGTGNQVGGYCTFIGPYAGFSSNSIYNTFIGANAGWGTTSGQSNTFVGEFAGTNNSTGSYNTSLGAFSLISGNSGDANTLIGYGAGADVDGSSNTLIGREVGITLGSGGESNTMIGDRAGANIQGGYQNIAIGTYACYTDGIQLAAKNIAIGDSALLSAGSSKVIAIGNRAAQGGASPGSMYIGHYSGLSVASNSYSNTFIGYEAGRNSISADSNVFLGYKSGRNHGSGRHNVYVGLGSGPTSLGSDYCVYVGSEAGFPNGFGLRNIAIGYNAGFNNGTGNILIGTNAGDGQVQSNKLFIENSNATVPLIWGDFNQNRVAFNRVGTANTLEVEGGASKTTAGNWLANSDRRIKQDIHEVENGIETLMKIRPVAFHYTDTWRDSHPGISDREYYNVIAQEYREVFPNDVKGSGEYLPGEDEEILQVDTYSAQIVSIKAIQELVEITQKLDAENQALKAELKGMKARLDQIEASNLKPSE